jgi:F0F1-type ATP synthase membrane subunit c/vacuolar-type H+-ATPase subunit K
MMTDQELNKGLLTLKVIWSAMLMSLAVYLFVGLQILANVQSAVTDETFGVLKRILYTIALAVLIVTRFVRKMILSGKVQNRLPAQAARHPALQTYTTATILALAMSESIGICGLVLCFLGKNPMDLYLLILISAAAMFMYRPSKEELLTLFREMRWDSTTGGTTD